MKMKQTTIVAVVLGVLILVSAVQAVQLNALKDTISEGGLEVSTGTFSVPVASSGGKSTGSLPSNIKDLPQMVGGC